MVSNMKPTIVKVPNIMDNGLLLGLLIFEVSKNGTIKSSTIITICKKTPRSFGAHPPRNSIFPASARIEYEARKYHSGLTLAGVLNGSAFVCIGAGKRVASDNSNPKMTSITIM